MKYKLQIMLLTFVVVISGCVSPKYPIKKTDVLSTPVLFGYPRLTNIEGGKQETISRAENILKGMNLINDELSRVEFYKYASLRYDELLKSQSVDEDKFIKDVLQEIFNDAPPFKSKYGNPRFGLRPIRIIKSDNRSFSFNILYKTDVFNYKISSGSGYYSDVDCNINISGLFSKNEDMVSGAFTTLDYTLTAYDVSTINMLRRGPDVIENVLLDEQAVIRKLSKLSSQV